jgi:cell wall-associated NlpC family hydrolase
VASHKAPSKLANVKTAATLTAATATAVVLTPSIGHADPAPSLDQVKQQVQNLRMQADAESQKYDQANTQLGKLQQQVSQMQSRIAAEQSNLTRLQNSLGELAAAQYRAGGVDQTLQLMLSQHPDQYLQQSTTLSEVGSQQSASMTQIQQIQQQLRQDKTQASQALSQMQAQRTTLANDKSQIQQKLSQAQSLLNSLTAQQQAELAQQQAAAQQAAQQQAQQLAQQQQQLQSVPGVSGRAGIAVAYVESKLGDPYVWGATGPDAFDCSGLMEAAWAAAGVSIPRDTYDEVAGLQQIPVSDVQPGDLIQYYGGSHVGMYIGNGMVVHASEPGVGVVEAPMNSMPIYLALRV